MKLKSNTVQGLVAVCAMLGAMPGAFAALYTESFESGDLNGWNPGTLNGVVTSVDSALATDGTFGATNMFTVGDGDYGWAPRGVLGIYAPNVLDAGSTTLSMDVYQDWSNPEGWGLWANTFGLVFNNNSALENGGWTFVSSSSVVDLGSGWKTYTFDVAPYVTAALDPANGWSSLDIAWFTGGGPNGFVGTNGVQTIAVDNIQIVPECGTFALLGLAAMGGLTVRRRVAR